MKKLLTCILTILLMGCSSTAVSSKKDSSTSEEETKKVTITNNVQLAATRTSLSGYQWVGSEVGDFEETSLKETIRLFEEKGTAIVYYGYEGCPWCERALPELNKVVLKYDIPAYYVDASTKPANNDYAKLTDYLDDILSTNEETGLKEMYVPFVLGVKDGKVVGYHVALVDGFKIENDSTQMSDAQKQELQDIYSDIVMKVAD